MSTINKKLFCWFSAVTFLLICTSLQVSADLIFSTHETLRRPDGTIVAGDLTTRDEGSFIFAGEANGLDLITHPEGYTGAGGNLFVSVGIDQTSLNAVAMEIPVKNSITVWNGKTVTTGNLGSGIPAGTVDFESVFLHELGHSIGLGHVNAASESGFAGADQNYTKASDGANDVFEIAPGPDGVIGSHDDVRGDDQPLHYFQKGVNNPFTIPTTIDSTTVSRELTDLPVGETFPANADRTVATLGKYNVPGTEAAMQQGSFFEETQRTLAGSDVLALRYAESGLDEIAGTADDYNLILTYAGLVAGPNGADIVVDFDNSETGFAVSQSSGVFIGADHVAISNNNIFFNSGFTWHFNTTPVAVPEPSGFLSCLVVWLGIATVRRHKRLLQSP